MYPPKEDSFFLSETLEKFFKNKNIKNKKFLDMGSGSGIQAETLAKFTAKKNITCADIDKEVVEFLKARGFHAIHSNLFSKIKGKFDVIISTLDTVNYILRDKEIETFFKNIKNHISDNGVFIFDFNTKHKKVPAVIKKNGFVYNNIVKNGHWEIKITSDEGYSEKHTERFYNFEEMKNAIEKAKMKITGIYSDFNNKISGPEKEERLILTVEK